MALKWTLRSNNITIGFKSTGIWLLHMEAMRSKMNPSELFVPLSLPKIARKKENVAEIMEEGIPPLPSNAIFFC